MDAVLKEIDELRDKIKYHSKLYYEQDTPEISDYEYDMMNRELKAIVWLGGVLGALMGAVNLLL